MTVARRRRLVRAPGLFVAEQDDVLAEEPDGPGDVLRQRPPRAGRRAGGLLGRDVVGGGVIGAVGPGVGREHVGGDVARARVRVGARVVWLQAAAGEPQRAHHGAQRNHAHLPHPAQYTAGQPISALTFRRPAA